MKPRLWSEFFTESLAVRMGVVEGGGGGMPGVASGRRGGGVDPCVGSLAYDSREVSAGCVYFALPGLHADGHDFIEAAVENGAVVVVHQEPLRSCRPGVLYVRVRDSRFAMSALADAFYGNPSARLGVVGVTGTEGKSTTVYLLWQLLRLAGRRAGFISTVQHSEGAAAEWNCEHQTTPEAPVIQRRLAEMLESGCEYAVLEASSHGLSRKTNRLGDVAFDAAVMTCVTHEHLEFHGTWEQYRDDKANLFRAASAFAVVNAADPSAAYFTRVSAVPVYGFDAVSWNRGHSGAAALRVTSLEARSDGNSYTVVDGADSFTITDRLPGAFNAGNVLAALLTASHLLGRSVRELAPLVERLKPVRGRMTVIDKGQPFEVIVDYAHTPSSFEAILPPLHARAQAAGARLIALFGSAGERDTQKRSVQGALAARYCGAVILTDEDPRGEEPAAILEEIAAGVLGSGVPFERDKTLFLLPDRALAIRKAFAIARSGDIVVLLGKGHENSIIYTRPPRATIPWNEIAEAEAALEELRVS